MKEEDRAVFESLTDKQLLAVCIYGEARGESFNGRRAVGSVVLNRVAKGGWFGKTIKEVILKPYQFSCFLENNPNFKKLLKIAQDFKTAYINDMSLRGCMDMAEALIDGTAKRNTKATHYKTLECKADWTARLKKLEEIGNHEFYV